MTLKSRLTLLATFLFAVGLIAMGTVTFLLVRSFLVDRLDEQVAVKAGPGVEKLFAIPDLVDKKLGAPSDVLYSDLVIVMLDERGSAVGTWPATAILPRLPSGLPGSTRAPGASVTPLTVGSGSSHYRVLARQRLGSPGTVVVALPLREVDATLRRLLLIEILVGGVVLLAMVVLARYVLGAGLRPLEQIADTADDIAAGSLSRRAYPARGGTEVARLGTAFNEMLDRLEVAFRERQASEELLRRFVADASHELRTPLTSIRGYAELTRRLAPGDDEARRNALARIEGEATRMSALVEDLLLLARLDQGREGPSQTVDVARVAQEVVDAARELEADRPLEVITNGEAMVEGDPIRLRQVLTNLVGNARSHTPPGTPVSVHISAANGAVVVDVHDDGPGIAAAALPHVFDRFYRADSARTHGTGGSGLGLSIVKSIVDSHHGRIEVHSDSGDGTTFSVTLPASGHEPNDVRRPDPPTTSSRSSVAADETASDSPPATVRA